LRESLAKSLSIFSGGQRVGRLIPVGIWVLQHVELVRLFSDWRSSAMEMFFSRFEASPSSSLRYLRDYSISDPNRILFVVQNRGHCVGHIGLANVSEHDAEIDNVIRGRKTIPRNLMALAQKTLVTWAFEELELDRLWLRVISNNQRAKALYSSIGFTLTERRPLRTIRTTSGVELVPCGAAEADTVLTCDYMTLVKKDFV